MITNLGDYGYVPNFWERNRGSIIFFVIGLAILCLIIGLVTKWRKEQNNRQTTEQKLNEVQNELLEAQQTNQQLQVWLQNRTFGRGFSF